MQPAGLRPSSTRVSSSACSRTAAGSTSRRGSGTPTTSSPPWRPRAGGSSGRARRGCRRLRARGRRLEVPLGGLLGRRRRRVRHGALGLVVVPAELRGELAEHAGSGLPHEAGGLVVLRDGVAERYVPGRNAAASPYRFELDVDPETWFLEDDGYELAVFHSHVSAPPRPSRTDVENIGLWSGRPYLIYTVRTRELAGWRIAEGTVEQLRLA